MFSFKPALSLSSFTLIKRLFSSSSLSAIRVVSSAYLGLLLFLLPILIPSCNSSSRACLMMCSVYRLNKQGDSRQCCCIPFSKATIRPSNPPTGHIPGENHNSKRHMYPMFPATLFTISRTWKQPGYLSADEWINCYIYNGIYSTIKRNNFESVVVKWMNLEPVIQNEISQKEKN